MFLRPFPSPQSISRPYTGPSESVASSQAATLDKVKNSVWVPAFPAVRVGRTLAKVVNWTLVSKCSPLSSQTEMPSVFCDVRSTSMGPRKGFRSGRMSGLGSLHNRDSSTRPKAWDVSLLWNETEAQVPSGSRASKRSLKVSVPPQPSLKLRSCGFKVRSEEHTSELQS